MMLYMYVRLTIYYIWLLNKHQSTMTSRTEYGIVERSIEQCCYSAAGFRSFFRDESGAPNVYDSEKSAKNCRGIFTKAAAQLTPYTKPEFVNPDQPSLYEFYTGDGIRSGLDFLVEGFHLNGKPITVISGTIHYFRTHPRYWRDRLRKMRACGLNCIDTYIPWNLHEPEQHNFDWGDGDNDYSMFADIASFLKTVQEEDLFAIIRPGPFICAEWEFGGLPSWLLRIPNIVFRTSEIQFMTRMKSYFKELFRIINDFQFRSGGPIIAFQVDNEYASVRESGVKVDKHYLAGVKAFMESCGAVEMFLTADNTIFGNHRDGSVDGALRATNFGMNPEAELALLKNEQPDKPLFVMEFWSGWFDHWLQRSTLDSLDVSNFTNILERILKYPASVNIYMFAGGTNWGFMNGANIYFDDPSLFGYQSITTSYDYDAPLSEHGDYNEKYGHAKQLIEKYNPIKTRLPVQPTLEPKTLYMPVPVAECLPFEEIYKQYGSEYKVRSREPKPMELLDVNNGNGQSYGYVNYRRSNLEILNGDVLKISGHIRDIAIVMIDGITVTRFLRNAHDCFEFGFFINPDGEKVLNIKSGEKHTLDILVENWGRSNFGTLSNFSIYKGLPDGAVLLNNIPIYDWEITAMEFKCNWIRDLQKWMVLPYSAQLNPTLYRAALHIDEDPKDTWIDFSYWIKGVCWINGYNLGRYLSAGPQTTLYVPGPVLKKGYNEIIIFEHYKAPPRVTFINKPSLGRYEKKDYIYKMQSQKWKPEGRSAKSVRSLVSLDN